MYKFIYTNGQVHEWNVDLGLLFLIEIAGRNPNVHQIVRDNQDQEVVWERECPAE